jgi:hypothetical protein
MAALVETPGEIRYFPMVAVEVAPLVLLAQPSTPTRTAQLVTQPRVARAAVVAVAGATAQQQQPVAQAVRLVAAAAEVAVGRTLRLAALVGSVGWAPATS